MAGQSDKDRRIKELEESLALQTTLLEQAEARAEDSSRRAEILGESHGQALQDQQELHERHSVMEAALRDQADQLLSHKSALEQREVEFMNVQAQLDELMSTREQHIRTLEQANSAVKASASRADELDEQYQRARDQISQLETDLADLRGELEARNTEVDSTRARLQEAENSWAKSREEADAFRALTTGSLGKLLDSHRDMQSDEDRASRGHAEKINILEGEIGALRSMLKDATHRETLPRATSTRPVVSSTTLRSTALLFGRRSSVCGVNFPAPSPITVAFARSWLARTPSCARSRRKSRARLSSSTCFTTSSRTTASWRERRSVVMQVHRRRELCTWRSNSPPAAALTSVRSGTFR